MATITVQVRIDQKAALIAGKVLRERESIEVDQGAMGEHWKAFVSDLQIDETPWCWNKVALGDTDPVLIRGWYERQAAQADALRAEAKAEIDTMGRIVRDGAFEDYPFYVDFSASPVTYRRGTGHYQFSGFNRAIPSWLGSACVRSTNSDSQLRSEYWERYSALESENSKILKEKNDAAFAAYLPAAQAAYEVECAERAKLEAEKETAEKAAREARCAERLASGYWTKETPSYNDKRHGPFWCASVSFESGPKPIYTWGESTGKWGQAGILRVACKPGEIIAWGQKDLRRADKSDHYLLVMNENGSMSEISRNEAWAHWQKQVKA